MIFIPNKNRKGKSITSVFTEDRSYLTPCEPRRYQTELAEYIIL